MKSIHFALNCWHVVINSVIKMIVYFPAPYLDESFYSLIGRYQIHTLTSSFFKTKGHLFGKPGLNISPIYPVHINAFSERTKLISNWEPDEIIDHFTLWPYYFSFVNKSVENDLRKLIKTGRGLTTGSFARFGPSYNSGIKYCPNCLDELKKANKEIYWNLRHQIPNLQICIIHNCFLEHTVQPYSIKHSIDSLIYPHEVFSPEKRGRKNELPLLLKISKHLDNILQDKGKINLNFNERLESLNIKVNSKNPFSKIKIRVEEFFREVPNLGVDLNTITSNFICGSKWKANPYLYALFDFFLTNQKIESSPAIHFSDINKFGKGPWVCLNSKCLKYNQKIIVNPQFKFYKRQQRSVGLFTCDTCKSNYTRSHLIVNGETKIFIRKNVTGTHSYSSEKPEKILFKQHRELFWQLRLNAKSGQAYHDRVSLNRIWLKKHDANWLAKQTKKLKSAKSKRIKSSRDSREKEYLTRLQDGLNRLLNSNPVFQITKSAIIKKSGFSWLSGYPKIDNFFAQNVESLHEFRIRRLHAIADRIIANGEKLSPSKLLGPFHNNDRAPLKRYVEQIIKNNS